MLRPKSILPQIGSLLAWRARSRYAKCGLLEAADGPGPRLRLVPVPPESESSKLVVPDRELENLTSSPLILIADHRGEDLGDRLEPLALDGYRTKVTKSLRASLRAVERELPAAIVVNTLSRFGAEELRALDRARTGDPPIPLLWLTNSLRGGDLSKALDAMQNEVWDLADHEAPADEIRLRVGRLLADATRLGEIIELRHRAQHDDRTDLLRPKAFEARLSEHVSACQRHNLEMALVLIDLDKFGQVNKQHDHTVGDILIAQAGEIIRRTLRTEDVAGRIGGDEFAVVLPYTHKVDAARVVGRLVEAIHKLSGRPAGARDDITVSASIGFETFNGRDLESAEELRTHAERALRSAKVAGGNQGIYYRQIAPDEATSTPA